MAKFLEALETSEGSALAKQIFLAKTWPMLQPRLPDTVTLEAMQFVVLKLKLGAIKSLGKQYERPFWPRFRGRFQADEAQERLQKVLSKASSSPKRRGFHMISWLRKALDDPDGFLSSLASSPAAKRFLLAQLQSLLQPLLPSGVVWKDVVPVLEQLRIAEIQLALTNPRGRSPEAFGSA